MVQGPMYLDWIGEYFGNGIPNMGEDTKLMQQEFLNHHNSAGPAMKVAETELQTNKKGITEQH